MKLSELIHQLQRYHDLYPDSDPDVMMTLIDYCTSDTEKKHPEHFPHTFRLKCFETRTLVHIPSESLFSERGPYLNIYYEREFIDNVEDYWHNTYFQQHGKKQTQLTDSTSCPGAHSEG